MNDIDVYSAVEKGLNIIQIAKETGINPITISTRIDELGLREEYKKKRKEKIEKFVEEGLEIGQMAEKTGLNIIALNRWIDGFGLREQYEKKMSEEKEARKEEYLNIIQSCMDNLQQNQREHCVITCYPVIEMVKSLYIKLNLPEKVLSRAKAIVKHAISNSWFSEFFGKNRIGLAGAIISAAAKFEGVERTYRLIAKSTGIRPETIGRNFKIIKENYRE